MFSALMKFFAWFLGWIQASSEQVLAAVWAAVPEGLGLDLGPFGGWVAAANHWLPISEVAIIVVGVLSFKVTFVVVKLTIKMIPTIG